MILSMGLLAPVAVDAGAWTTPGGTLWTKVSWFRRSTDEWYADVDQPILLPDNTLGARPAGSRQPYRFNGQYESVALVLEGYYGITDAIDVGFKVPWFDQYLRFRGLINPSMTTRASIHPVSPASATPASMRAGTS